jgi:glucosyl-3-phosphoglycerate phosphatase
VTEDAILITLVRHGESVANRSQRWQGQGNSELSALGRAQAEALADRLRTRDYSLIVASDLERASATARALGRPFERDASFREFDIGAWEGLTRDEVVARFGDELARLEAGEDVALGGGESYVSFCARVDAALARLRARLVPGDHALVVCHGGVIGALVSGALGLRGVRDLPIARAFNTSVTQLSYDGSERPTLRIFNDSLHLAPLALFPHPVEMARSLALVCNGAPHAAFGSFAAHYDAHTEALLELRCASLLDHMRSLHPEARVSLAATAPSIQGWIADALWREAQGQQSLHPPSDGALCHVAAFQGRPMLVDYGVAF